MKSRRHHNNTGSRQIRGGKTHFQVSAMAKKLGIPFRVSKEEEAAGSHPDWETKGRKKIAKDHDPFEPK